MSKARSIYISRVSSALTTTVLHQTCVFIAFLAWCSGNPLSPTAWCKSLAKSIFSFKMGLFLVTIITMSFLQVVLISKRLVFGPKFSSSRLVAVINTLSLDNLSCIFLNVLIGCIMGWMYNSVTHSSQHENSTSSYKILCAMFAALYYSLLDHIHGSQFLQHTTVELQVKTRLWRASKQCMKDVFWPSVNVICLFVGFHYLFGDFFASMFLNNVKASMENDGKNLFEFINITQMVSCWAIIYSVLIVLSSMKAIVMVCLACSWRFPIAASLPETSGYLLLFEALALDSPPAVQQLAAMDLKNLSELEPTRRAQVFLLSQPGGHPRNWKALVTATLAMINTMTDDLSLTPVKLPPKPEKPTEESTFIPTSPNIRNLAYTSDPVQSEITCLSLAMKIRLYFNWQILRLRSFVSEYIYQQISSLLKQRHIAWLVGQRPDARVAHVLLLRGDTVAALARGISTLAQASYKEDAYGVVQQDLPSLITALLRLKAALDKLGNTFRKSTKSTKLPQVLGEKNSLRTASLQSIYKISSTFKDHTRDLNLSPDTQNQLQGFVQFRES